MKKKLLSLALALALCLGLAAPVLAADTPALAPGAWELFSELYRKSYPKDVPPLTVEEMAEKHGEFTSDVYVGIINHFYDTGDTEDLSNSLLLNRDGTWKNVEKKGKRTPLGNEREEKYLSYIPKSNANGFVDYTDMTVTEKPFPDVPVDAWYAEAVAVMKDSGIINGCDDGLFHPEREVTVGEFYAMLLRAATYDGANIGGGRSGDGNHWASSILYVAGASYFYPPAIGNENALMDRTHAVTRIAYLHERELRTTSGNKNFQVKWAWELSNGRAVGNMTLSDIVDHAAIEEYVANTSLSFTRTDHIVYAYNNGIAKGVDETGRFNPYGTLTRAEVAQMLYNARLTERYHLGSIGNILYGIGEVIYDLDSKENFIP